MDTRRKRRVPQHHLTVTLERMPDDTFTASLKMAQGRTIEKDLDIKDWVDFLLILRDRFNEAGKEIETIGL